MKLLVVYNPRAGHGRAERMLDGLHAGADALGLSLEIRSTARRGHAVEIVAAAQLERYGGVVACGGDGTLFEVVNGCFRNPAGAAIPVGVVPVGTGNAFARDLGLQTDQVHDALELIAAGKTRRVDVGRCRTQDDEYHYLNILGLGFVSDVTATAVRLKRLGNIAYTLGVLYRTVFLETFPVRLELDGEAIEREAVFIEVSNSRYTADFLMAPAAELDDGLLDVTLLGPISRRRLLRLLPTVYRGEHVQYPEVETFTASRISVVTDTAKALTPDGEIRGAAPAEIECLRQRLSVFG